MHWTSAVVVEKPTGKKGEAWRVGLADGRVVPLSLDNALAQRKLALYDVVFVRVVDGGGKNKGAARAELRVRPDGAGHGGGAWRTRPGASSPWPGAFRIP